MAIKVLTTRTRTLMPPTIGKCNLRINCDMDAQNEFLKQVLRSNTSNGEPHHQYWGVSRLNS